ncbi:MerR family transcriptional regulator [Acetobacter lovaniensis]|uniref:DNA-binding transcriptional MerR regulator n=1 Tax=Acetobacter lovaniensis TaxID=104100 RepID=A0A841QJE0_9PROT|nr:helix-turn-helix domain-containing protein [Acetobacter lovaniensis]MBB6458721.1 DNA-binding transcriptional MerR regulator [Acetobacter lovaniensis]NHN82958.1 MerR family transcriptional regulator [Acetobacter lovaniensis]GBQ74183.1 transcriptional regulator MerR [Acetobacter lovaniensis NRIC 0474]
MLSIGKLSGLTGVKVPTIRYYEQIGLLPKPERNEGGQRIYNNTSRERLNFIRHARELGFPLEDIRELLALSDSPDQSCDAIAKRQLAEVEHRLVRLNALYKELERMVAQCTCGTVQTCRVIQVLGDHGLCVADHQKIMSHDIDQ